MRIFLREGSTARNLKSLLPVLTPENERGISFCTDDRQPKDLLEEGSIDHLVRTAIACGVAPVRALRMATLNPAEHFRLFDRGIVAPGYRADMMIFRDLSAPRAEMVFHGGVAVASDGAMLLRGTKEAEPGREIPPEVKDTVRVDWHGVDFGIPPGGDRIRVIGIVPDQLITESLVVEPKILHGRAVADPERDLLKIAVIERHRASGRIGLGFVRGMGLRRGAVAGTVAHDHHNLLVIGADDASMETAARAVAQARRRACRRRPGEGPGVAPLADRGPLVGRTDRSGARPDGGSSPGGETPRLPVAGPFHDDELPRTGGHPFPEDHRSGIGGWNPREGRSALCERVRFA